jgi:hypothetical protein
MSNIFQSALADIEGWFSSGPGLEVSEFLATAAGTGSAVALIEKLNPSNKTETANDIFTVANALYTLLSGSTPPTQAQVTSIFAAFKSDAATTAYDTIAEQLATSFSTFIASQKSDNWIPLATAYVYGWQLGAQVLGGSATATSTPAAT